MAGDSRRGPWWWAAVALLLAGLLAAGVACASVSDGGTSAPRAQPASGLYGTVTRGPTRPVCQAGKPCSKPAAGAQLLFTRQNRVVARVVVGRGGRYRVRLAPGVYRIELSPPPKIGTGIRPSSVRVPAGTLRPIDFSIDTGIR